MCRFLSNIRTITLALLLPLFMINSGSLAIAQNTMVTVTGVVVDSDNQPVLGAAVQIKGTEKGALVNEKGEFKIRTKSKDVLVFSMMGYQSQEILVGTQTHMNVVLIEDAEALEAAVVEVGYGSMAKKDITGSVAVVGMRDILKAPVVNFDEALAGRLAGVSVSSADGTPGSDMNIVVRGANSLTQSNSPLYVIDGFPIENFSISAINANDIESMSVLKDASATAIYGARGANGVIIIETKKGKEGAAVVTYNGSFGLQQVSKTMEMMSAREYVEYNIERKPGLESVYLTSLERTLEDYDAMGKGIDWQSKLFRLAPVHSHNISMRGGTSGTNYSVSLSHADQEGVIINSGYNKTQGRVSLTQRIGKKLKFTLNASYTTDKSTGQTVSSTDVTNNQFASYLMFRTWAYRPILLAEENLEDLLYDDEVDGASEVMNPILSVSNDYKIREKTTFMANGKLEYSIIKPLRLTILAGYNDARTVNKEFNNSNTYSGFSHYTNLKGVNGNSSYSKRATWMNENILNFDKRFGGQKHRITAMAAFSLYGTTVETMGYSTKLVPIESLGWAGMDEGLINSMTATISDNYQMSGLARINYDYDARYLLTASFRADGSSKFSKKNRWGYFPSAAFGWCISEEKFMRNVRFINNMKLRLSYGVTGNNRVGDYATYSTWDLSDYYSFGNSDPYNALLPDKLGNDSLKWESTEQVDLGLDLSLFRSRIGLTVDLYQKITDDLLLNAKLPYATGYSTAYMNVGKIRNRGLEIALNTVNVQTRDFMWTSDFNISLNRSTVMELADGEDIFLSSVNFTGSWNSTYLYLAKVGEPIAQFYGYKWDGVYGYEDFDVDVKGNYVLKSTVPTNGDDRKSIQPGDVKYVDINGDGVVNGLDMTVIGRCEPLHEGGFNNTFTYKGLSLNVFFTWRYGVDVMNANRIVLEGNELSGTYNQFASYADRWSLTNTDSKNFRVGGNGPQGRYSNRTIEDASFIRLKTLQLSYSLPKKWTKAMKMSSFEVSVSAQNLFTWTKYSGMDPEVSVRNTVLTPGFDYSAYARNRVYNVGLRLTF